MNLVYIDLQGALDRIVLDHRALGYTNVTSFVIAPTAAGGGGDPAGARRFRAAGAHVSHPPP